MKILKLILLLFLTPKLFAIDFTIEGNVYDTKNLLPITKHYINIHDQQGIYEGVTVYTNLEGFYSVTFHLEDSSPIIFIVQTYGYCENYWLPYTNEVLNNTDTITINFKICHNPVGLEETFTIEGYIKDATTLENFINHKVTITENYISSQQTELFTDQNGYYLIKYTLPPLYSVDFVIETSGNCEQQWITYSDTIENFDGTYKKNFNICHDTLWYITDFKINGKIFDDVSNLPVSNHPIYITRQTNNYQTYKITTNDTGYYSLDFEINLLDNDTFKIKTFSYCDGEWITYIDSTIGKSVEYKKDFYICPYTDIEINCLATFDYSVDNETNIVTFYEMSLDSISDRYWTLGDGYFSSNQFFTHQYIEKGIYDVCLNITNQEECVNTSCKNLTVGNYYNLQGSIYAGQNLLPEGKILLFRYKDNKYKLVNNTDIVSGLYSFEYVFDGFHMTYAIPTFNFDLLYFPKYLPTYQSSELKWLTAGAFHTNSDNLNSDINLIKYDEIFYGEGGISGELIYDVKKSKQIKNFEIAVILYDENNNAINFSAIDNENKYSFSDLPFGTYKIYPENGERDTYSANVIINSENPVLTDINFSVTDNTINFIESKNVSKSQDFIIFPNPVSNEINITSKTAVNKYEIVIFDILGKKCYSEILYGNYNRVDLKNLDEGIYILQVINGKEIIQIEKIRKL